MLYARLWPPSLLFFSCLFVAWARVTCSILGLPSDRSLDRLIVVRVLLDLKWCLCGFDLLLGWRRDLCTVVHHYIALFNRLDYCSCFRSVCTPLMPKVISGIGLSSISLRLTPELMTSSWVPHPPPCARALAAKRFGGFKAGGVARSPAAKCFEVELGAFRALTEAGALIVSELLPNAWELEDCNS
jgi:hypothetical protein